jgi:hypothetical protein
LRVVKIGRNDGAHFELGLREDHGIWCLMKSKFCGVDSVVTTVP